MTQAWPEIPFPPWRDTCAALHLWTQIVGKYRLAHTPWLNHSWHATLYVTPRGLTTGMVPDGGQAIALSFDLHDQCLVAESSSGNRRMFDLEPMSVAAFYTRVQDAVQDIGGSFSIHGRPNELASPVPFADDHAIRPYDPAAVQRFHEALVVIDQVFSQFRTGFVGNTRSP